MKKGPATQATELKFVRAGCWPAPKKPVKVRSRYGLPGALDPLTNPKLPEHLANANAHFPGVIASTSPAAATDDPAAWARALKPQLDALLPQHGVVMVRGLEKILGTAAGFGRFMEAIKSAYDCRQFMEGRSMTSTQVGKLVRTGSDDHPAYTIEPHNEYNVAAANRPRKLFLTCSIEPTDGGEWVISDGEAIMAAIPKDIVEKVPHLFVPFTA
jgi:hypothetical protein